MKTYTKNSCKKLLTASLIALSYCAIKADDHRGVDPKRSLATLQADIIALGTPSDASGIYADFQAITTSSSAMTADLTVLLANDVTMIGDLSVLLANDIAIAADIAALAVTVTSNAAAEAAADATILAAIGAITPLSSTIIADIVSLGTPSDISGVYADFTALNAAVAANTLTLAALAASENSANATIISNTNSLATNDAAILTDLGTIQALDANLTTNLAALTVSVAALTFDVSQFAATLAFIASNLQLDPVSQANVAINNLALQTVVTSADANPAAVADLLAYQTLLGVAIADVTTSITFATQSNANTQLALSSVNAAMTSFNTLAVQWNSDGFVPSSAYSVAEINGALAQLQYSLSYYLTQQPV